ncbi:MAG: oligopeptide/dipeptide ABC transporter ATP-binding protein [Actinomycetes bacterium]
MTEEYILQAENLVKHFPITKGAIRKKVVGAVSAVNDVNLAVRPNETLGLVGESGCGKSTAGRTILKLIQPTAGKIIYNGRDITGLSRHDMVPLRRELQMIFQDPYSSLNPRHTVGAIISAPYEVQGINPPGGVKNAVRETMERVGLNPEHYNRYPNEFSGGQRQRIGIARAVTLRPKVIVCDEPVSALDVSIQAQVINLLQDLQDEFGIAYVFVAHDLSVVRQISHRVAVMYLGSIVEITDRKSLYASPLHPYTHALMSAVPVPDPRVEATRERIVLRGDLPSPINLPSGCVFHTRCFRAEERCRVEVPKLVEFSPGHQVACHFPITEHLGSDLIVGPDAGFTEQPTPEVQPPSEVIADMESAGSSRPMGADYVADGDFTDKDY